MRTSVGEYLLVVEESAETWRMRVLGRGGCLGSDGGWLWRKVVMSAILPCEPYWIIIPRRAYVDLLMVLGVEFVVIVRSACAGVYYSADAVLMTFDSFQVVICSERLI